MDVEIGNYITTGKCLGTGSFGSVDLARDKNTKKTFAIKRILKKHIIRNGMGSQVKKEIFILKNLNHPNIVHIQEVLMSSDSLYIVMEYVSGGELYNKLTMYGNLPESKCVKYSRQICDALAFCHELNICHRDIKPQNILVDSDDNIRLIDFGFASIMEVEVEGFMDRRIDKHKKSLRMDFHDVANDEFERSMESKSIVMKKMGTICGTQMYMAPEILREETYRGDKIDIWAFGTVVYFLLMGVMPFLANDKSRRDLKFPKDISDLAQDFILCMLDPIPSRRFSAKSLLLHRWIFDDDIEINFDRNSRVISSEITSPSDDRSDRMFTDDINSDDSDGEDVTINMPDNIDPTTLIETLQNVLEEDQNKWFANVNGTDINISTTTRKGIHLIHLSITESEINIVNADEDCGIPMSIMNHVYNLVLQALTML